MVAALVQDGQAIEFHRQRGFQIGDAAPKRRPGGYNCIPGEHFHLFNCRPFRRMQKALDAQRVN
jgi:hypothetical protein